MVHRAATPTSFNIRHPSNVQVGRMGHTVAARIQDCQDGTNVHSRSTEWCPGQWIIAIFSLSQPVSAKTQADPCVTEFRRGFSAPSEVVSCLT